MPTFCISEGAKRHLNHTHVGYPKKTHEHDIRKNTSARTAMLRTCATCKTKRHFNHTGWIFPKNMNMIPEKNTSARAAMLRTCARCKNKATFQPHTLGLLKHKRSTRLNTSAGKNCSAPHLHKTLRHPGFPLSPAAPSRPPPWSAPLYLDADNPSWVPLPPTGFPPCPSPIAAATEPGEGGGRTTCVPDKKHDMQKESKTRGTCTCKCERSGV